MRSFKLSRNFADELSPCLRYRSVFTQALKKKKAPALPEPLLTEMRDRRLLQGAGDAAEGRGQLRAEALHDSDDRDGNAGSDQAVLDGRRARLVLGETRNERFHG